MNKSNKKFMLLSCIGIIMVVDAHSWGALNLFSNYIPYNSFFMPMFIFISGYFNKVDANTSLKEYVLKKFKSLMLPYFCISFICMLCEAFIYCYKASRETAVIYLILTIRRAIPALLSTGIIVPIADPMWFVPTLFITQIVYAILKKSFYVRWNSKRAFCIFALAQFAVVYKVQIGNASLLNVQIFKCIFMLPFLELGLIYRDIFEDKLKRINKPVLLISLLLINMCREMLLPQTYDIAFNNISTMSGFTSPLFVTPLLSSVIGILFWVTLVDWLGDSLYNDRIINYISLNTFWIMGFHLLFFNILNCILMAINRMWTIKGFDENAFIGTNWYRYEEYSIFRLAYFVVGLVGALAVKKMHEYLVSLKRVTKDT